MVCMVFEMIHNDSNRKTTCTAVATVLCSVYMVQNLNLTVYEHAVRGL